MRKNYPDSFILISKKEGLIGFDSLSEEDQIIFSVWWLEAEVNNGGFHQVFWNSAGNYANQTLSALEKVGADKNAALLKSAMDIVFGGVAPVERDARQLLLEQDEERKYEELSELDTEFYKYEENFHKLINEFIVK
ncbi:MAG: DMP19 family protein [Kangiellaceae bacterium]|nr:DMP19 family protein [Kangiellaceae bacterium]